MSNISCGIWVFFVTSFLCSLKFVLFQLIGHTKRCLQTNIKKKLCLSFCDLIVPSKSNVPSLWLWPIKVNFCRWIDNDPISVMYAFQIDISTNSWAIKYQYLGIGLYMLNVAHVKNDVKWRPIVTKFGTLIENMSRAGLYDCHIF